ncbi:MAG: Ig-like domain-containing protein, partial [Dermatophilaceae bacterium]
GAYSVSGGRIVFTPLPGFVGAATPVDYRVEDANGTVAESTYSPTVTEVAPTGVADVTTGPQGVPQSVNPLANDTAGDPGVPLVPASLTLLDGAGDPVASVTVPGEGTYTVSGGRIVFTPLPGFVGAATPVDYQIEDANGTVAESTYAPTFTAVTPTAVADVTTGPQGVPQSVNPLANDRPGNPGVPLVPASLTLLDGAGDPVASVTVPGEGTYTVSGGRIVFTPLPDFTGSATPVDYQVEDANGTTTESTYAPTVVAETAVEVGFVAQTAPQGTVVTLDPSDDVPGLDPTSVYLVGKDGEQVDRLTVPGEGTWAVDPETGKVTFTPEPGFTGNPTPVRFGGVTLDGTPVMGTLQVRYVQDQQPATGDIDVIKDVDDVALADTGLSTWTIPLSGLALLLVLGGAAVIWAARRQRGSLG